MMEIGLRAAVGANFSGSVSSASPSVELLRNSRTFLLGERKAQSSYQYLEQNQSTSVGQCSTSGFHQISIISTGARFRQRPGRRGTFCRATKEAEQAVVYRSMVVPVERDDDEEVVLWLTPSSRRSRDRPGCPDMDMKAQSLDGGESTGEALTTEDDRIGRFTGMENFGSGTQGIEGRETPDQKSGEGGWRGLGSGAVGKATAIPKAFLLRKPVRDRKTAIQRQEGLITLKAVPKLGDAEETRKSESSGGKVYLTEGLFKSLASPQSGIQRTSAVEKYFGDELRGRLGGVISSSNVDNFEEGSDGWTGRPRNPAVLEGGERLKINLDLELYRARTFRQKGKLIEAEAILTKCIRNWPDDGRPYVALGRLLVIQNKVQEARVAYERGCQAVRGENAYIWQAWAVLEERSGNLAKARKLFDAATVADKKHAAAWHGWAKLELRAGNVKRASSLLNKGLRFCGSNEYLLQTLALIESRAGKIEQARSLLARATQHNPKSAASWLAWALMESQNGLHDTARRLFQKGIIASPKNRYVWQAWALFEARQGNKDRARELFQRGHELNPKDAVLLQAFALFEYECGRAGLARDYFRRALVCDSSHQPVWIAWGWMEWKQGNISVARELYQGAIQADTRSMDAARAFQAWGVLEDREGDTGLARELFKCALKIDSQNVPTWMSWAAMEEREGRSVRADEIRNLFLQQRTEVVDEQPWNVDISDMLAPAIDKIKGFFRVDQRPPLTREANSESVISDYSSTGDVNPLDGRTGVGAQGLSADEEFDVELFLREKFPWKYGSRELFKPTSVLEAIDRSLKRQSRGTGKDERLDVFMNKDGSREWK